ncbi:MAG: hypothetical protein R2818_15425 [Flavobacteriales bacterium]
MYTYNKESNEVNLSDPNPRWTGLDPSKLFTQYEEFQEPVRGRK